MLIKPPCCNNRPEDKAIDQRLVSVTMESANRLGNYVGGAYIKIEGTHAIVTLTEDTEYSVKTGVLEDAGTHRVDTSKWHNEIMKHSLSSIKFCGKALDGFKVQLNVKEIDLSELDTSQMTDMRSMFYQCNAYHLDLTSCNTANVTDMSDMFYGCRVQNLNLNNIDTSNVVDMSGMFEGCYAQSLDLSSFSASRVTDITYMFQLCHAKSIDLSNFHVSYTVDMDCVFTDCYAQVKTQDAVIKEAAQADGCYCIIVR